MRRRMVALAISLCLAAPAAAQEEASTYYPELALRQGVTGTVTLDCIVGEEGRLSCQVVEEAPAYWEFGDAALQVSTHWRMSTQAQTGQPTAGARLRRTLVFEPGPPARIRHEPRRRAPTPAP